MNNDWLIQQMEHTKRRLDATPNGGVEVEHAKQRAEELNRAEVEEHRRQNNLKSKTARD
jgi:hypothetical protein